MTKTRDLANLVSGSNPLVDGVIDYSEVTNTPTLASVATSGSFNDLSNQPTPFDPNTLAAVATTGAYADVTGTPAFASQAEAEAATNTTKLMTPALVGQSIAALRPSSTPELLYYYSTNDSFIASGYSNNVIFMLFSNVTTNAYYLVKSSDGITWTQTASPNFTTSTHAGTPWTDFYCDDNFIVITQTTSNLSTNYTHVSSDMGDTWSAGSFSSISGTNNTSWDRTAVSHYMYDGTYYWAYMANYPDGSNRTSMMRTTNFISWVDNPFVYYYDTSYGPYLDYGWAANGVAGAYGAAFIYPGVKKYTLNGSTWLDDNRLYNFSYGGQTSTNDTSYGYHAYQQNGLFTAGYNLGYIKVNFSKFSNANFVGQITGNGWYVSTADYIASAYNGSITCSTYSQIANYPLNAAANFTPVWAAGHSDYFHYNNSHLYFAESFSGAWSKLLYDSTLMNGNFVSNRYAKTSTKNLYITSASQNAAVKGVNIWSI